MKIKKTKRGFAIGEFADRDKTKCSVQKSSLATDDCIWLGVDNANPVVMNKKGKFEKVKLPKDTICTTRMHLTRKQVKELLPVLELFVECGDLTIFD